MYCKQRQAIQKKNERNLGLSFVGLDNGPSRPRYSGYEHGPVTYPNQSDTSNFYPRVSRPTRPEDDILHQWRVKRRLETARDVADHTPANRNTFGFLSKHSQSDQVEPYFYSNHVQNIPLHFRALGLYQIVKTHFLQTVMSFSS